MRTRHLQEFLAGVRVTSATSFEWHRERVELPPVPRSDHAGPKVRGLLVARLQQSVYSRFYLTGVGGSGGPPRCPVRG